jgi:hypothetical protein
MTPTTYLAARQNLLKMVITTRLLQLIAEPLKSGNQGRVSSHPFS